MYIEILKRSISPWAQLFALSSLVQQVSPDTPQQKRADLLMVMFMFLWACPTAGAPPPQYILTAAVQVLAS